MKHIFPRKPAAFLVALFLCILPSASFAGSPRDALMLLPGELQWVPNQKLHGLETVVLDGDPSLPEPYAQRIRLKPGTRLEPHTHPNKARMVTVLQGTLYFGFGERFEQSQLKAMPEGSFFTEPVGVPHFAVAGDREVILQLNAIGPDGTTYVGREGGGH